MDLNKYTIKAQEALNNAVEMAGGYKHQAVENAHILKSLLLVDENISSFVLQKSNANLSTLNNALDAILKSYPKISGASTYFSDSAKKAIYRSAKKAKQFKDQFISVEHIYIALAEGSDDTGSLMKDMGMTPKVLEEAVKQLRKGGQVNSQTAEDTYNALNRFAINLNHQAENGKMDPVIGRDDEIRRILQILSRRTKNNPILIGEPGVGKTAIAEGIAHRIINGDVPENLKTKEIFSLDMGTLIAGAKYKGEFEERLKSVVKEVIASEGEIVLFIDEIHTLVGAGASEGAMDAANILKPALARGELRAIGATTLKEYQRYFEKDKALERRFQTIVVDEPSVVDAISILRGLRERYEVHHQVRIKDEAVVAAVELSHRYINDRFLPDKAIDLVDEAAAKLKLEINSVPQEIDEIERKIMQLEIEKEAMKREGEGKRLQHIKKQIAEMATQRDSLRAKWDNEKSIVENIQQLKKEIDEYRQQAERAEREGDYGTVAEIRYGKIKHAEQSLDEHQKKLENMQASGALIKEEITSEDIAEVVSRWTGIPVNKMLESEKEKLLNLEEQLHKRVIGQDEAIQAVSEAIRRSRAGLQDEKRPIGSFIFLGTTGVGKTELAKALAKFLFNDENLMVRIDMSEYQERHAVSRLVGAPPGYVGYEESGQLTEAVRRKPYSVILLDEIEKAHPDVFNILLQVLDEGRLTDNKGRTADFKNAIIIMTSNIGSQLIMENFEKFSEGFDQDLFQKTEQKVFSLLKGTVRPEFLNRVDEIIMFTPLNKKEIRQVAQLHLQKLKSDLKQKGIFFDYSEKAIERLGQLGFNPQFGARPLKRVIHKRVLNKLSEMIIAGELVRSQHIYLDVDNDEEFFWTEKKAA